MKSPFLKSCLIIFFLLPLGSCATYPTLQPQVQSLVIARQYDQAIKVLNEHKKSYGKNNELLYDLDCGVVLQLAGRYQESSQAFERAKSKYDELYTESVSRLAASWLVNDYILPYRGEDFERVMINIFQAMNYAAAGNISEALVEARNVNSVLTVINQRYSPQQRNVYKDDAFARMFAGILFQASGSDQDMNDAFLSDREALQTYEDDYKPNYGFWGVPLILKENLITTASFMGMDEHEKYRRMFPGVRASSWIEEGGKAQVFLIFYHGFSPLKIQNNFVLPAPKGYLVKIAFPKYQKRSYAPLAGLVCATANGVGQCVNPELGEDIEAIAMKNLENRKFRVLVKAGLRPLVKYALSHSAESQLEQAGNKTAAEAVHYAGVLYGLLSEQSDLRSWQTLPAQIWIARLSLAPGAYQILFNGNELGFVNLAARETKFFILRTW